MGHVSRFRLLLIMLALAFCASLLTGQSVITQAQDATPTAQNSSAEAESTEEAEATAIPRETANHAAYEILQQDFETASDVTRACLTCHNQADEQLHATAHWNWEFEHPETGQLLGKRHIIDNNVLDITENQAYCGSCHFGERDVNPFIHGHLPAKLADPPRDMTMISTS